MDKQYEEKLETALREAFWAYENALGTELAAGVVFRATSDFNTLRDTVQTLHNEVAQPLRKRDVQDAIAILKSGEIVECQGKHKTIKSLAECPDCERYFRPEKAKPGARYISEFSKEDAEKLLEEGS